jgi:hypothetical protein
VVSWGARDAAELGDFPRSDWGPDEANVCLDGGHFIRRDRRLGTLVGSAAVDE